MSQAIAFDTHRFVKNLTASGFTEAQAEALADEQTHLLDSNLATKADIAAVRADLELKTEQVRVDLEVRTGQVKGELEVKIEGIRSEVQKAKADLLKWMVGALTAHAALITGVVAGIIRTL